MIFAAWFFNYYYKQDFFFNQNMLGTSFANKFYHLRLEALSPSPSQTGGGKKLAAHRSTSPKRFLLPMSHQFDSVWWDPRHLTTIEICQLASQS